MIAKLQVCYLLLGYLNVIYRNGFSHISAVDVGFGSNGYSACGDAFKLLDLSVRLIPVGIYSSVYLLASKLTLAAVGVFLRIRAVYADLR